MMAVKWGKGERTIPWVVKNWYDKCTLYGGRICFKVRPMTIKKKGGQERKKGGERKIEFRTVGMGAPTYMSSGPTQLSPREI